MHHHCADYTDDAGLVEILSRRIHAANDLDHHLVLVIDDTAHRQLQHHHDLGAATVVAPFDNPAVALRELQNLFDRLLTQHRRPITATGTMARPTSANWPAWARYESIVNIAFADYPLDALCLYHNPKPSSGTDEHAIRTHPCINDHHGCQTSARYTDPDHYLRHHAPPEPQAPAHRADITLHNPSLAAARTAVTELLTEQTPADHANAQLVTTELVANATHHGKAPVTVRCWHQPTHLVIAVTDRGPGHDDPLLGWLAPNRNGGRGLWITRQLTDHLTHQRHPGTFTVTAHLPLAA